eukprot:tig00000970_g5842.t1
MGRPVSSEPAGARPKAAAALQRYFGPLLEKAGVSRATLPFALAVLALDLLLNVVIIYRVPYTEIDWVAYMQQVEMYVAGERNYTQIRGDTGHLPYPAGHLWIYVALWRLSGNGANIRLMQFLFGGLHTLVLAVVLACYIKTRAVPVWVLALPALSRRIHSIFVLRLFNDCFAALFAYVALYLLASRRPTAACFFFSVGISVKMNVLLYAPALLLLLVKADGLLRAIPPLLLGAAWQVAVAGPFLATYPWEYASRAFNFGRQFIYYWSVNFKMVPEELFLSRPFAASLLATHLVLILGFAHFRWCRHEGGLLRAVLNLPAAAARKGARGRSLVQTALGARGAALNPDHILPPPPRAPPLRLRGARPGAGASGP